MSNVLANVKTRKIDRLYENLVSSREGRKTLADHIRKGMRRNGTNVR